ncbi:MAG: type II CAAX endopeptidase family protein [Chitinophagaceae bacterium]
MNSTHDTAIIRHGWLRVLIFGISYFLVFLMAGEVYGWISQWIRIPEQLFLLLSFVVSFAFSMLTVYVFRRGIDGRSLTSLGFEYKGYKPDVVMGLLLALVLLVAESLILYFTGYLKWTEFSFNGTDLLSGLIIMILVAISEEAVFRGYILHNLMQSMNRWIALAITSLLFALLHAFNPNITWLALLNIFLAGFVMGIVYVYTGNLWFAIAFHFSWNFFLGPILGYEVSGLPLESLLQQSIHGPDWLTGGEFGLEGSVLDGAFSVMAFGGMLLYVRRGKRRAVSFERRAATYKP